MYMYAGITVILMYANSQEFIYSAASCRVTHNRASIQDIHEDIVPVVDDIAVPLSDSNVVEQADVGIQDPHQDTVPIVDDIPVPLSENEVVEQADVGIQTELSFQPRQLQIFLITSSFFVVCCWDETKQIYNRDTTTIWTQNSQKSFYWADLISISSFFILAEKDRFFFCILFQ